MGIYRVAIVIGALMFIGAVAITAATDGAAPKMGDTGKMEKMEKKDKMECPICAAGGCPMCAMCGAGDANAEKMMKQMGMSEGMMMRCKMMKNMKFDQRDPAAILGNRDMLKLTDDQVKKLTELHEQMCQQALGLLTDAQKEQLNKAAEVKDGKAPPTTMKEMHQRMNEMHQEMHKNTSAMTDTSLPERPCYMRGYFD